MGSSKDSERVYPPRYRRLSEKDGGGLVEVKSYLRGQRHGAMLVGWKGISEYMGISATTAYNWYKRYQFPVVRLVGARVFTTRTAIDRWIERMSLQERKVLKELGFQPGGPNAAKRPKTGRMPVYGKRKQGAVQEVIEGSGEGASSSRGHSDGSGDQVS